MKRFWIVLLSLGLVMAFGVTAFALTMESTGQVYFRGWYANNPTMQDPDAAAIGGGSAGSSSLKTAAYAPGKGSAAAVDQRIRLANTFNVEDGLTFTTRMDWIEDTWGNKFNTQDTVAVDVARIDFKTAIGAFSVGPQVNIISFGTRYQNSSGAKQSMKWTLPAGPMSFGVGWEIETADSPYGAPWDGTAQQDHDSDIYYLRGQYKTKPFEAGLQYVLVRDAKGRTPDTTTGTGGGSVTKLHDLNPYFIANLGPLYVEGEGYWVFAGKKEFDHPTAANPDADARGYGAYINVKANLGPAYLGLSYTRNTGDDPGSKDKIEGTFAKALGGGTQRMGSIFFSGTNDYAQVFGAYIPPSDPAAVFDHTVDNVHLVNIYGGYQVTPKIDIAAVLNFMQADKTPVGYVSDDFGKELDFTANFKIYDHLTYSLDAAYFWVGDFFKGKNSNNPIGNNYMLRHTLNLDF